MAQISMPIKPRLLRLLTGYLQFLAMYAVVSRDQRHSTGSRCLPGGLCFQVVSRQMWGNAVRLPAEGVLPRTFSNQASALAQLVRAFVFHNPLRLRNFVSSTLTNFGGFPRHTNQTGIRSRCVQPISHDDYISAPRCHSFPFPSFICSIGWQQQQKLTCKRNCYRSKWVPLSTSRSFRRRSRAMSFASFFGFAAGRSVNAPFDFRDILWTAGLAFGCWFLFDNDDGSQKSRSSLTLSESPLELG
jgi:hypothetical protein